MGDLVGILVVATVSAQWSECISFVPVDMLHGVCDHDCRQRVKRGQACMCRANYIRVPSLSSSHSIVASLKEEDQAFLPLDCLFFRAISDWKTMRFLGFRLEILLRRSADFARFCFFKLGARPVHCMASTVDGLDTVCG